MKAKEHSILLNIRNSPDFEEGFSAKSEKALRIAFVVLPLLGKLIVLTSVDNIMKASGVLVVAGMAVGAVTSFASTFYFLGKELDNAKECALFVCGLLESMESENKRIGRVLVRNKLTTDTKYAGSCITDQ